MPSRDGHQVIANRRGRRAPNEPLELSNRLRSSEVLPHSRYEGASFAVDCGVYSDLVLVAGRCRWSRLGRGMRDRHGRFTSLRVSARVVARVALDRPMRSSAPKKMPATVRHLPMMMPHPGERTMKPPRLCHEPGSFDTFVQDFRFAASAGHPCAARSGCPLRRTTVTLHRLRARHERPVGKWKSTGVDLPHHRCSGEPPEPCAAALTPRQHGMGQPQLRGLFGGEPID